MHEETDTSVSAVLLDASYTHIGSFTPKESSSASCNTDKSAGMNQASPRTTFEMSGASKCDEYATLDDLDLHEAVSMGLLDPGLDISRDAESKSYGVAQTSGTSNPCGCGGEVFSTQKELQERCKLFAVQRGFQLTVAHSSSKPDGGGNAKYKCKKLSQQQFYDPKTPKEDLRCPFYMNCYGKGTSWKVTRACFLHNHYKFVGTHHHVSKKRTADSDSDDEEQAPCQRNTTLSTKNLCRIVADELSQSQMPLSSIKEMKGKGIRSLLLKRGLHINPMTASRVKRQLLNSRYTCIREDFQRLESYLNAVREVNNGSVVSVEKDAGSVFQRAILIPHTAIHAVSFCPLIVSLDRVSPTEAGMHGDEVMCGVYLKASIKDPNDELLTFAFALVRQENEQAWAWFIQQLHFHIPTISWESCTVIAGRQHGLEAAIETSWSGAAHHYCMKRIVEDMCKQLQQPLTPDVKHTVYALARSDSPEEYHLRRSQLHKLHADASIFMDTLPGHKWIRYLFLNYHHKPTYNVVTCDLTETSGAQVVFPLDQESHASHVLWFGDEPLSSTRPLHAFHQYATQVAHNFIQRRQSVVNLSPKQFVPKRANEMEIVLRTSQKCEAMTQEATIKVRMVAPSRFARAADWYNVHLPNKECSCRQWQDRQFPCAHAVYAAEIQGQRLDSLYPSEQNSIDWYRRMYSLDLNPVRIQPSHLTPDLSLRSPLPRQDDQHLVSYPSKRARTV